VTSIFHGLVKCISPSCPLFDGAAVLFRISYFLTTLLHLVTQVPSCRSHHRTRTRTRTRLLILAHDRRPFRRPAGRSPTDILHPKAKEALLPHPGRAAISRGPHEYQPIIATSHLDLTDLRAVGVENRGEYLPRPFSSTSTIQQRRCLRYRSTYTSTAAR